MNYLAIIGTAGRKEDGYKLSRSIYMSMFDKANSILLSNRFGRFSDVTLISGGAAWADHIAVSLHKHYPFIPLELYLPAKWDFINHCFSGIEAARIANYYHQEFSNKVSINTLEGLEAVLTDNNVTRYEMPGFKIRNSAVAKRATGVLAFTFGEGDTPKDGGTKDTWDKCPGKNKLHVPISSLL